MTKRILLLFLFCVTFIGNAQSYSEGKIEQFVSDYIKNLQLNKIDTICVYESYCVGYVMTFDSSIFDDPEKCTDDQTNSPVYLFWKEKGKTFLSKVNYCYEYSEIMISNDRFWEIYFSNKDIIENEKFKRFEYESEVNSKKKVYILGVDHTSHNNFKFIINNKIIEKRFNNFDLQKDHNSKEININYNNNINLKSKSIIELLKQITSEAEKNNTFKKIKSR